MKCREEMCCYCCSAENPFKHSAGREGEAEVGHRPRRVQEELRVPLHSVLLWGAGVRGGWGRGACHVGLLRCTNMSVPSGRCLDLHGADGPLTGDAGEPGVWNPGEEGPCSSSEEDQLLGEPLPAPCPAPCRGTLCGWWSVGEVVLFVAAAGGECAQLPQGEPQRAASR